MTRIFASATTTCYENLYEQVLQSVKKVLALMKDDEAVLKLAERKTADKTDHKKLLAEKSKHEKRLNVTNDTHTEAL